MAESNLSFDWYPVGTGPYMLTVQQPESADGAGRAIPTSRGAVSVAKASRETRRRACSPTPGKPMPFIDQVVFSLEKESIPYWNKFLQGYYDASGITSDNFDQVIQRHRQRRRAAHARRWSKQGIRLQTSVATSIMYMGFNMLDPVVGGESERARKLRQAISIAIDQEEFISIFPNGRGIAAQGPIPPGIFGYEGGEAGINRYVYDWVDGEPRRKSIEDAKQLLAEAGYPKGIDRESGKPLIVYFDSTMSGVGAKARIDWLIKQFQKINLQLVMRTTDYNRFQEKMRKGTEQLYYWGWNADYPDPENFLFLFYGPQGKVKFSGENASNYANPEFDRLFERMREMENGPAREAMVDRDGRRSCGAMRPGCGASTRRTTGWRISGCTTASPTRWPTTRLKYQRIDPIAARAPARRVESAGGLAARAAGAGGRRPAVGRRSVLYRRRERAGGCHRRRPRYRRRPR